MSRPRVLINCDLYLEKDKPEDRRCVRVYEPYIDAVVEAGGLPVLVPPSSPEVLRDYLELADGVVFTGGDDYPPELYGQKRHKTVRVQHPDRAASDAALIKLARASDKPALGICAGLQLLAISEKGALIQHLPRARAHMRRDEKDEAHGVTLTPESRLREIFGKGSLRVNSAHHQAADPDALPKTLRVSARADDGTIEGLELKDAGERFFVFVQWHPERIFDAAHRRRLFKAFIDACRRARG